MEVAVSFKPRPLYPQGKSTWYPMDRKLSGPLSRSGRGGEEKNSQPLSGLELLIIQPVAQRYTTELAIPAAIRVMSKINIRISIYDTKDRICVVRWTLKTR
jgi:hypothetical protein